MADPLAQYRATLEALDRLIMAALSEPVTWRDPVAELEGRRNVARNHHPVPIGGGDGTVRYACAMHGYAWEDCLDWRDAAAGLEVPDA